MSAPEIRRGETRGAMRNDWLDARFSFSFGGYDDPARRRFGPLLALNEDRVRPGTGFPMHAHRDLEIVVLPLAGEVEHHDDLGGHAIVRPGQWQWMRAGTGIHHRQWNPSSCSPDHHLQLWLEPRVGGRKPKAEVFQMAAPVPGAWQVLLSPEPRTGGPDIGVDGTLSVGVTDPDALLTCDAHGGGRYLHVIDGHVEATDNGQCIATLEGGDALVFFSGTPRLGLKASGHARLLSFDTRSVDRLTGLLVDRS